MIVEFYFNYKYTTNRLSTLYKVSVSVKSNNGNNNVNGLFCVVANPSTKQSQCQRYAAIDKKNYVGAYEDGMIYGLSSLIQKWNDGTLSDTDKEMLKLCVSNLEQSCEKWFKIYDVNNAIYSEKSYLMSKIEEVKNTVLGLDGGTNGGTDGGTNGISTPTWERISLADIPSDEVNVILKEYNAEKATNPNPIINHKGQTYRVANKNASDGLILERLTNGIAGGDNEVEGEIKFDEEKKPTKKPTKVRKKITVAQMIDASNLTEFLTGCYYLISNTTPHSSNHIVLLTNDGEERTLRKGRVKMVNVYDEPPVDETEEEKAEIEVNY